MPSAASFVTLVGNPTVMGNKKVQTIDWTAPNPYVVGGVSFPASNFNIGGFESGYGSVSQSGNYRAELRFSANGAGPAKVVVFVMATGLEAGAIDLSAEKFRLTFVGV